MQNYLFVLDKITAAWMPFLSSSRWQTRFPLRASNSLGELSTDSNIEDAPSPLLSDA
jgi:hypothetical protein